MGGSSKKQTVGYRYALGAHLALCHGPVDANDAAAALIAELDVVPEDNPLSQALAEGAAAKRAELVELSGHAFDCAYATNELGYHQLVNQTVAESFIPAVTVEPLRDLPADALETFLAHEAHAGAMVEGLQCG